MAEFQWKVWKHKLFYTECLWISYFFQIFTFIGSSLICLSLSEIPIWTHQREFGLSSDSFINRSCFFVLSSDFCIVRLCWPVLRVQMTPKKLKQLWGQTLFLSGRNFSAELAGKFFFCNYLLSPKGGPTAFNIWLRKDWNGKNSVQ